MFERDTEVIDRMDNVRIDLFQSMREHEIKPNEALTLLTSLLIQIYDNFVENNSRENFTDIVTQCYDTYKLITTEAEGSIQ